LPAIHSTRQTAKFDQLSELRWLYRLALGQPHQQDFIERIAQLKNDGRQEYVLSLSAWPHFAVASEARLWSWSAENTGWPDSRRGLIERHMIVPVENFAQGEMPS
jgi:hypothetical protein